MTIINVYGKDIDLSALSRDELLDLQLEIHGHNDRVKMQLAKMRSDRIGTDDDSYRKTWNAVKMFGRYSETVKLEIMKREAEYASAKKREVANPRRLTIHKAFLDIARIRLDPAVFNQLLSEAKEYTDKWNSSLSED